MASNSIPVDRVRIFSPEGEHIAEFKTRVERSWAVSDEGRAQFTIATRISDIVNRETLQFGNWLLIQNDSLPPWVGVIDTPRSWSPRAVTVSAYTPEHLFGQRRGPYQLTLRGSAGDIFEYLLARINAQETTILTAGDIDKTGIRREETVNPTPLNKDLSRIQERSLEEYRWRPVVNALGKLVVYADWQAKIGVTTSVLLHEGKAGGNIEMIDALFVEDGNIYNDILGYGDGLTWATKAKVIVKDEDSIGTYGLRQYAAHFNGVTSAVTLRHNSFALLSDVKEPKKNFKIRALNVGDTFEFIDLGNIMNLQLQNMGFGTGGVGYESQVRIMAMRYDPALRNKIELVVEEKNE